MSRIIESRPNDNNEVEAARVFAIVSMAFVLLTTIAVWVDPQKAMVTALVALTMAVLTVAFAALSVIENEREEKTLRRMRAAAAAARPEQQS